MKHLDLFSGIGGFALAAQTVWGNEYENIGFCEIDKYCQEVLKKRFPGCRIWDDIRTITYTTSNGLEEQGLRCEDKQSSEQVEGNGQICGRTITNTEVFNRWDISKDVGNGEERRCGNEFASVNSIDMLTGGFPCQPFSQAGKRKGTSDNRYLWPEMLRVISEVRPRWVIGENVSGIWNMVLNQVCIDLEAQGYDVTPFIIPACAVNAPHRRDRVWIVAFRTSNGLHRQELRKLQQDTDSTSSGKEVSTETCRHWSLDEGQDVANTKCRDGEGSELQYRIMQGTSKEASNRFSNESGINGNQSWEKPWIEVATSFCGVDDGLPVRMDGFELSKSRHRVERLKALGNAIVPQVVIPIMQAIKAIDEMEKYDD